MTSGSGEAKKSEPWRAAWQALAAELSAAHPRLHAHNIVASFLPPRLGDGWRARLLRSFGFEVGEGTEIKGPLKLTDPHAARARLRLGRECIVEAECSFELSDDVHIGDRVVIEPGVTIFTSSRELESLEHRAGKLVTKPVSVGDGALLRARSIILPGVRIGAGAVVEVGAVVSADVPAHTRVGGAPLTQLERLRSGDET